MSVCDEEGAFLGQVVMMIVMMLWKWVVHDFSYLLVAVIHKEREGCWSDIRVCLCTF